MQAKGHGSDPSNFPGQMPATDDEIREKYLERAIRELNRLTHDLQECELCPRGGLMPVLGSGHPQGDVFLLKHSPSTAEVEEGVAFYGRAGSALMKSFKRLGIDPLTVYGTLCVKCPVGDPDQAAEECVARLVEEIAVVQPRIIVVMGERALATLNDLDAAARAPDRAAARRGAAADADGRGAVRAGHRRRARRGTRQEGVLARLPPARRVVRGHASVLAAYCAACRRGNVEVVRRFWELAAVHRDFDARHGADPRGRGVRLVRLPRSLQRPCIEASDEVTGAWQTWLEAWDEWKPEIVEAIEVDPETVVVVTQVHARGKGSGVTGARGGRERLERPRRKDRLRASCSSRRPKRSPPSSPQPPDRRTVEGGAREHA